MSDASAPILLTGATGFIGRRVLSYLLDAGRRVHVLVRPASAGRPGLDPRCRVYVGELTDADVLCSALAGVGGIIYCAGTVRGRCLDDFLPANVHGVGAALDAMTRTGPMASAGGRGPRLLLLSSLAASRPELSDYARSKRRGEELLERAAVRDWTILRPPAVYGPGDTEMRPLLNLVRRGLVLRPGPPDQRLALLHVDDLVRAVAAWLQAPAEACSQRAFTLDDGRPGGYSWQDIAAAVSSRRVREIAVPPALLRGAGALNLWCAGMLGYAPMLTPGKARELQQPRWLCDNAPFSHATGWQPEIGLERGAATLFD
ncbi:MAG: NAD(P)-dependent oxidoreductase [Gammaproteobacteria bacterium]|nr:NAD(P)-dependent oxidoreductase [Gammaproteobacteria bacterium]